MNLSSDIWKNDNLLRQAFSWLTRIGVAPKFGSLPIAYYQQDQCKAIDDIVSHAAAFGLGVTRLRFKSGYVQAWQPKIADGLGNTLFRAQWRNVSMVVCGQLRQAIVPPNYAGYLKGLEA